MNRITQKIIPSESAGNNGRKPVKVCILTNSNSYFLNHVIILEVDKGYRLIVIKDNVLVKDAFYYTSGGAKIAFSKEFINSKLNNEFKAFWSDFYVPEKKWFKKILSLVEERTGNGK